MHAGLHAWNVSSCPLSHRIGIIAIYTDELVSDMILN